MSHKVLLGLVAVLLLAGCASGATKQQAAAYQDPNDPFESVNRTLWDFNYDVLDAYFLRPVTIAYVDYMPQIARTGLLNVAENLEEPSNSLNNLLQGKIDGTFISLGRFLLNSTVGLLGLIDVASEIGLQPEEEEFGEVLGKWGVGTGPYLMIPAMGPSDIRSGVGDVVDSAYSPIDTLNFYLTVLRSGIKVLETRASVIEQEQQLNSSVDPYAFVKSAYFQNLEFKVNDGEVKQSAKEEALDDELDAFLEDL
ncbi:VacJ family lipoprotein [Paraglaciecola aquimarina]|uniref:VacJ family lipoprotein n=1 Tax=Paraglaciecola aquimarina TaxID=1235557 RepID=A0ABU3T1K1_9ALTE|nr:VacJ family lipoprotein [Paraglaciecola aquimarina]MDU0356130.1 VacJ family lipoprotein [Paraglaciecola aquimarina]